jgi:asparagine synthetase B (glutamine-hydrolysing)
MSRHPIAADSSGGWHDEWVVRFDPDAPPSGDRAEDDPGFSVEGIEGSTLTVARTQRFVALLAGTLTNARELSTTAATPAQILLGLFEADAARAIDRLRGPFVAIVWDRTARRVYVARDHIGIHPIYYARSGSRIAWSASPLRLRREPGISGDIDAVTLAEWLCGWYPSASDTAFAAIKRIPPATLMTVSAAGVALARYWDPSPEDEPIRWLEARDLDAFDDRLERAVARTMDERGPTAIFLSGGVDSIAVAANAADLARRRGAPDPLALSLVFPDAASNESDVQAGVARQLGLVQSLVPFDEAAGPTGLLDAALRLSASWPQPLWNMWAPAYMHLARLGCERGARTVLTGRGGDEWLTVTPYLFADLIARADVRGAWRLLQTRRRSHGVRTARGMARLLWLTAGRPLASAALDLVAPAAWHRRRRARLLAERPGWVAPDPAIRAAMDARIESWMTPARPPQGFYVREMRTALMHPGITHDMEETQEFGRRLGQRLLHPFWDVDLVTLLYRTPPALLIEDGRSKSLLRKRLAQRLPGLGLERRVKVSAGGVFKRLVETDAPAAWERLGGLRTLSALGVVSSTSVQSGRGSTSGGLPAGAPGRIWTVLTFESWLRRQV